MESSECWWCNCGRRQSRHRLFVECRAWPPQTRRLWRGSSKDCGWEHPRAPAVRWLWEESAIRAVLEFLEEHPGGIQDIRQGNIGASGAGGGGGGREPGVRKRGEGWARPAPGCVPLSFP